VSNKKNIRCQTNKNDSNSWIPRQMIFLGILISAILVNLIQYPAIDYHITSVNYPSLKGYVSYDLFEIACYHSGSHIRDRFGPYLGLSKIAPGVNVIVPINSTLTNERLYGLGLVRNVERINYDAEIVWADFNPDLYKKVILGGSESRGPGKTVIVLYNGEPETLVLIKKDVIWYLVDIKLIPNEILKEF
jgi:hypothetical protein